MMEYDQDDDLNGDSKFIQWWFNGKIRESKQPIHGVKEQISREKQLM